MILTDGAVDTEATATLRARLRAERGPVPFFDRGPGYPQLAAGATSAPSTPSTPETMSPERGVKVTVPPRLRGGLSTPRRNGRELACFGLDDQASNLLLREIRGMAATLRYPPFV